MAEVLAAASRGQGSSMLAGRKSTGECQFASWDPVYRVVLPTFLWVLPPQFNLPRSNFTNT